MSASQRYWTTVFAGLAAACSATSMALSARHVYFVHHPGGGSRAALAIQYFPQYAHERLTSFLGYVPYRWTVRDLHALIATGVIGTVGGLLAVVLQMSACKAGRENGEFGEKVGAAAQQVVRAGKMTSAGLQLRRMRLSNRFLAIYHALLLAVLTIGFAVSWSIYEQGRGAYFWSFQDRSAFPWNFERWNCAIAWSIEPTRSAVSPHELLGLCRQARAARVLMLCAFVLAALALAVQLLVWREQDRDQAWRGQDQSVGRDSQASTVAVEEPGSEAISWEKRTTKEMEARGDDRK